MRLRGFFKSTMGAIQDWNAVNYKQDFEDAVNNIISLRMPDANREDPAFQDAVFDLTQKIRNINSGRYYHCSAEAHVESKMKCDFR